MKNQTVPTKVDVDVLAKQINEILDKAGCFLDCGVLITNRGMVPQIKVVEKLKDLSKKGGEEKNG